MYKGYSKHKYCSNKTDLKVISRKLHTIDHYHV